MEKFLEFVINEILKENQLINIHSITINCTISKIKMALKTAVN